jgi:hypothetical protein
MNRVFALSCGAVSYLLRGDPFAEVCVGLQYALIA